MRDRDRDYLFAKFDLADSLKAKQSSIQEQVDSINKDQFLATPYDDLIDLVVNQITIEPITLYEDKIFTSEPSECKVDVSGDPRSYVAGHEISIEIPFTGDYNLLRAKTSTWSSVFPTGQIKQGRDGVGKIIIIFRQPHDSDPNQIKSSFESNLNTIKDYLSWSKTQVEAFNQSLSQLVKQAVDFRREKLKKQNSLCDVLGIPLKQKNGKWNIASKSCCT